ncbi:transposase InsO family protein [Bradyrhizobium sp. RT9b]|uniref:hypothetical protein n=1 Tax=Bradyrhizobium sp. RT9b TaxID=3156385 RepID=UPI0033990831
MREDNLIAMRRNPFAQYASTDYRQRLAGHEITVSTSRPDNAKAESFMKSLKTEEVLDGRSFKDLKAESRSIGAPSSTPSTILSVSTPPALPPAT